MWSDSARNRNRSRTRLALRRLLVEAFEQEHAKARDMIITDPAGLRHVGNPIKYREEPAELKFEVPDLDSELS